MKQVQVRLRHRAAGGTTALLLALAALVSGCDPATRGDLGAVRARYDTGLYGCIDRCDADEPIAEGAVVDVVLTNLDELPACAADSGDPAILLWAGECDSPIRGEVVASGQASLLLYRDLDGGLLDRFWFDVSPVAHIDLTGFAALAAASAPLSTVAPGRFLLAAGGTARLFALPFDADDRRLVGVGGLAFSASGPLAAVVTLVSSSAYVAAGVPGGSVQDFVEVIASAAPGPTPVEGTLCATALAGTSACVDAALIGAAEVSSVEVTAEPKHPHAGEPWFLDVRAATAAGEIVHSPACEWSVSPKDGATFDGEPARDAAIVIPAERGIDLTVTCVVGTASGARTARVRR